MKWCELRKSDNVVTRSGTCQNESCLPAARAGCVILQGIPAIAGRHRIEHDGFDKKGTPINPRVLRYFPPPEPPGSEEDRPANITKGQYQQILARLTALEKQSSPQTTNRTVMFEDGIDKLPKETEP